MIAARTPETLRRLRRSPDLVEEAERGFPSRPKPMRQEEEMVYDNHCN